MAYYFRIPLFVMNTLFEMRFDFQVKSPLAAVNQFRTSNANPIAVIILHDTRFHSVFCDGRVHEVYPVESSSGVGHFIVIINLDVIETLNTWWLNSVQNLRSPEEYINCSGNFLTM